MASPRPESFSFGGAPWRALANARIQPGGRVMFAALLGCALTVAPPSHAAGTVSDANDHSQAFTHSPIEKDLAHADPQRITLDVGQTVSLAAQGVARVAVGSGQVVQATTVEAKEVLLFARGEGTTSVQIWRAGGRTQVYTVHVRPAGFTGMEAEVSALLQRIPGAKASVTGDSVVIEGNGLSDTDRTRIAALAQRYPRILDFTGQVGWDNMVLLDVQVVELPRSRLREFGMAWDVQSATAPRTGAQWTYPAATAITDTATDPAGAAAPRHWLLQAGVGARLTALAERGDALMLAQPQLIARSGSTANFLAGGEVPYTAMQDGGRSETQFKPYGVGLTITPQIDPDGGIRCRIEVEASAIDTALSLPAGPALRTRRASTEFNVPSGRTLVIGGFLSRETSRRRQGLPLLSDIPVLGALFSVQREERRDTELVIFVTPTVMGPDHPMQAGRVHRARAQLQAAFPESTPLGLDQPVARPAVNSRIARPGSQWATSPAAGGARP